MRRPAALVALVLLGACSRAPSVIQVRPVSPSNAPDALASALSTALEVDIPADATLHIALADREDHLDVETSTKVVHHLPFEAKAGERITITVRAQPHSGEDVLRNFVEPLGGSAAVEAVVASSPAFAQRAVVEVETVIAGPGRRARGSFTFLAPHHMTSEFSPTSALSPGAPLRLLQWVMSKDSKAPATALRGADLVTTRAGRPVSEYGAPLWTMWLQVTPTAPPGSASPPARTTSPPPPTGGPSGGPTTPSPSASPTTPAP